MTSPIAPDDTAALVKIVQRVTRFDGCIPATVATAIAEAVCPPGYVVVSRDDLRMVIGMYRVGSRNMTSDDMVLDRLRAALEGQG